MLRDQGDRFREYLQALDKQREAIGRGDAEALLSGLDLEEHLLRDISNIQKVIEPLEALCRELAGTGGAEGGAGGGASGAGDNAALVEGEANIAGLRAAVERLGEEAAAGAARNRELLAGRMGEIREEIKGLRGNPYAARRSIYADSGGASIIDLQG
jgi:hypothetical protein